LIEHHVAARAAVEQRVGDQRDRLDRRMSGERFHATFAEGVDAGVGPDVRPVASEAAQLDVVPVRFLADAEDADELMLRSIERSLVGARFIPDHQVQHLAVKFTADLDQIADVTPIDADEVDCALSRNARGVAERSREERSKLCLRHLTRGKGELGMLNAAGAADPAHPQVIGRIGKDRGHTRPADRPVKVPRLPRIAAKQSVLSLVGIARFVLAFVKNALGLVGMTSEQQDIVTGAVLVGTLIIFGASRNVGEARGWFARLRIGRS
jgi:hypothetical protein